MDGCGFGFITVAGGFSVFRREVDALADSSSAVRHDTQAALEYGGDHSHVRPVPQQLAVLDALICRKTIALQPTK